jgi:septal ring-binding cell division protein DamX
VLSFCAAKLNINRGSAYVRFSFNHSIVFLLLVSLGGCGIFEESAPQASKVRVAPGTEKVTDDWHCIADQKGLWDCFQTPPVKAAESVPASAPAETLVEPASAPPVSARSVEASEPETSGLEGTAANQETRESYLQSNHDWQKLSAAAFVLQVAAHTSQANAETALTGLDAPGAEIVKTWSEKGDVFVIITGSYPDRSAAETSAEAFTARNPGTSYWIRSTSNFLKAL